MVSVSDTTSSGDDTITTLTYPDGSIVSFFRTLGVLTRIREDAANNHDYTSIDSWYATDGSVIRTLTTMDDGDVIDSSFDAGVRTRIELIDGSGSQPWARLVNTYDTSGRQLTRTVTEDDGDVLEYRYSATGGVESILHTDGAGDDSWTRMTAFYDPPSAPGVATEIVRRETDLPNGQTVVTTYAGGLETSREVINNATGAPGAAAWTHLVYSEDGDGNAVQTYSLANSNTLTAYYTESGVRRETVLEDSNGNENWGRIVTLYDSDGTTRLSATVYDDAGVLSGTVRYVNFEPVAGSDTATLDEDSHLVIASATLLGNDSDFEGDTLTIVSVDGSATLGQVTLEPTTGQVTYDTNGAFEALAEGETATDSFTYTITDGIVTTVDGDVRPGVLTATVTVTGENDAPVTIPLDGSPTAITEDDPAHTFDLLAGQTDVDGDPLSAVNIVVQDNTGALVAFTDNGDGSITVDPGQYSALAAGEAVTITVSYDVTDGTASTANTLTFDIDGVNDDPTATADSFPVGNILVVVDSVYNGNAEIASVLEADGYTVTYVTGAYSPGLETPPSSRGTSAAMTPCTGLPTAAGLAACIPIRRSLRTSCPTCPQVAASS